MIEALWWFAWVVAPILVAVAILTLLFVVIRGVVRAKRESHPT